LPNCPVSPVKLAGWSRFTSAQGVYFLGPHRRPALPDHRGRGAPEKADDVACHSLRGIYFCDHSIRGQTSIGRPSASRRACVICFVIIGGGDVVPIDKMAARALNVRPISRHRRRL
jgi:hypothetical protein